MDRLSGLDASFLYLESSTNLLNVCGLLIVDQSTMPVEYDFETLRDALHERIGSNPAFRRKLHNPILNLDHPVWVDDDDFDIENHVRRVSVPAPGDREQLAAVCGDLAGHALDRSRPLWEMWVIEGLDDGNDRGVHEDAPRHRRRRFRRQPGLRAVQPRTRRPAAVRRLGRPRRCPGGPATWRSSPTARCGWPGARPSS